MAKTKSSSIKTREAVKAKELFDIGVALWSAIAEKTDDMFFCINSGADYMVILSVRSVSVSRSQASIFQVYESKVDEDICVAKLFLWGDSMEALDLRKDLHHIKCQSYPFSDIKDISYIIKEAFNG